MVLNMRTITAAAQQFADGLFGQTRGRILALLYSPPHNMSYSIREIARLIGMSVGTVHRELAILVKLGLVYRATQRNLVYYLPDVGGEFSPDIRKMVAKLTGGYHELLSALKPFTAQISLAFTYPSPDRPDAAFYRDLLVVGATPPKLDSIEFQMFQARAVLDRPIHVTVYSLSAFERRLRRADATLMAIMQAEKMFVIGTEDDLKQAADRII
jgi:DNA-binding transcriptional ArsR family regulator